MTEILNYVQQEKNRNLNESMNEQYREYAEYSNRLDGIDENLAMMIHAYLMGYSDTPFDMEYFKSVYNAVNNVTPFSLYAGIELAKRSEGFALNITRVSNRYVVNYGNSYYIDTELRYVIDDQNPRYIYDKDFFDYYRTTPDRVENLKNYLSEALAYANQSSKQQK